MTQTQFGLCIVGWPGGEPAQTKSEPRKPEPIPLKRVRLSGSITHPNVARLVLRQEFANDAEYPVTALYKFPLDEGAAVCGFEAEITADNKTRTVKGTVKERVKAAQEYKEATEKGHGAFLLESEKDDVFQIAVGNLPAKASVVISLTLAALLPSDLSGPDTVRLTLPTTIGSQTYGTTPSRTGSMVVPGTPPTVESTGVQLDIDLDIKAPAGALQSIESPSHPISVSLPSTNPDSSNLATTKITLPNATRLNRDFVLLLRLHEADRPQCLVQHDPSTNTTAALLSLVPRFPIQQIQKELWFVIDRSGSMGGHSIENAKEALKLMLRSLPTEPAVFFNIVSFGSDYRILWAEPKRYSEESMKEAEREVDSMQADMGGTELLAPLRSILEGRSGRSTNNVMDASGTKSTGMTERDRAVIVLTDGEIWNTADLLSLVSRCTSTSRTRVFSLGIGAAVSTHLVRGLARAGQGIAEFVGEGERMEKKVVKMVKVALMEGVKGLKVDWGTESASETRVAAEPKGEKKVLSFFSDDPMDLDDKDRTPPSKAAVQQAPHIVPPLYPGSRYSIFAFMHGQPTSVKISGETSAGRVELEVPVILLQSTEAKERTIHVLAAKRLIQDLAESSSYLHDSTTGELGNGVKPGDVEREITRLGTTYGLSSTETAWIAIDEETKVEVGEVRKVVVPQEREYGRPVAFPAPFMMATASGIGVGFGVNAMMSNVGKVMGAPLMPMMAASAALPMRMAKRSAAPRAAAPPPPPMMMDMAARGPPGGRFDPDEDDFARMRAPAPSGKFGFAAEEFVPEKPAPTGPRGIFSQLISMQSFDGSWSDPGSIATICHIHANAPTDLDAKIWATMLAVCYLESRLADLRDEWELLVDKARKWIDARISGDAADAAWKAAARAVN